MDEQTTSAEQVTPETVETEATTTEATTVDTETKETATEEKTGAPESYTDFTIPEGLTVDAESATEFSTVAKELNLNQEQAQKLVDLYGAKMLGQLESQQQQAQQWADESKKAFKPAEIDLANKTLSRFADKEVIEMLSTSGLGNYKPLIAMFKNIGSQISEGNFVDSASNTAAKSAAEVLYPSMK